MGEAKFDTIALLQSAQAEAWATCFTTQQSCEAPRGELFAPTAPYQDAVTTTHHITVRARCVKMRAYARKLWKGALLDTTCTSPYEEGGDT